MKRILNVLNRPLTGQKIDFWFCRWGVCLTGLTVLALVGWTMPKHATNLSEMYLGLTLGVLTCLLLVLFGFLNGRLQQVTTVFPIPHRSRLVEYGTYAMFPVLKGFGTSILATLPLARAGLMIGLLVLLSLNLVILCMGTLFTLGNKTILPEK
jgi:hypothetical protein